MLMLLIKDRDIAEVFGRYQMFQRYLRIRMKHWGVDLQAYKNRVLSSVSNRNEKTD